MEFQGICSQGLMKFCSLTLCQTQGLVDFKPGPGIKSESQCFSLAQVSGLVRSRTFFICPIFTHSSYNYLIFLIM